VASIHDYGGRAEDPGTGIRGGARPSAKLRRLPQIVLSVREPPELRTRLAPLNRPAPFLPLLHTLVEERDGERRIQPGSWAGADGDWSIREMSRFGIGMVPFLCLRRAGRPLLSLDYGSAANASG
jgi:hypothetical protein